jgi:two-component system alkaline phosphatase synthesis response regulator PhoP
MGKRILVVEDDPTLSQVLRDNLLFEGFDIECVVNGGLTLSRCAAVAPDLVVLDLTLPVLAFLKAKSAT